MRNGKTGTPGRVGQEPSAPTSSPGAVPAQIHSDWVRRFAKFSVLLLSGYALVAACVTLIGWFSGRPRLTDWIATGIPMFANTAVGAFAAGIALLAGLVRAPFARQTTVFCAAIVGAIGAATLIEHLFRVDLRIDTLLVQPQWENRAAVSPGRMGPPAALSYTLLGAALLLYAGGSKARRFVPTLGLLVLAISLIPIVGYLFKADPLFSIAPVTGIALQTATIILALSLALLALVHELEPTATVFRDDSAGWLTRRALPCIFLVPLCFGWIFVYGRDERWFDRGIGLALMSIALISAFCCLLRWCLAPLQRAEVELHTRNEHLQTIIDNTPECVKLVASDGTLLAMNRAGLGALQAESSQQVLGSNVFEIVAPDHREAFRRMHERVCAGGREHLEFEILGLKGALRRMETHAASVLDPLTGQRAHLAVTRDVTERRHAEGELRKSQERLLIHSKVLESMAEGVVLTGEDGTIVYTNPASDQMFGYSSGEQIGKPATIHNDLPPEENRRMVESIIDHLRQNGTWEGEFRNVRKDGSRFITHAKISTLALGDGKFWVCVQQDITERKRAEANLADARQRLKTALAAGNVATWVWDIKEDRMYPDENLALFFGLPFDSADGASVARYVLFVHEGDRSRVEQKIACALQSADGKYEAEYRIVVPGRPIRWVIARGRVERDMYGVASKMHGIVLDVTARKEAEEALRESAARLNFALEAARLGDWDLDLTNDTSRRSLRHDQCFGYNEPVADWGFEKFIQHVHPEDRDHVADSFKEALKQLKDLQFECRVVWPDGSIHWIAGRGGIYRAVDCTPVRMLGVVMDITERKRAELALAHAQTELERVNVELERTVEARTAELRETIGELEAFSYSISHDLRSPLRAMQGYSDELLQKHSDLDAESVHYLHRINKSAGRMDLLIQDVLAYSRVAKGNITLRPLRVDALVKDIIEQTPELQAPGARIEVQEIPAVMGHEAYLTQCVSNLLANAVKFVPPGRTPHVVVRCEQRGEIVRLWFEDNGIGISREHHMNIFQIFGRVYPDKKYPGTGIGLAIVRKAVERMGGAVGVESELGQGSRFWIQLQKAS